MYSFFFRGCFLVKGLSFMYSLPLTLRFSAAKTALQILPFLLLLPLWHYFWLAHKERDLLGRMRFVKKEKVIRRINDDAYNLQRTRRKTAWKENLVCGLKPIPVIIIKYFSYLLKLSFVCHKMLEMIRKKVRPQNVWFAGLFFPKSHFVIFPPFPELLLV